MTALARHARSMYNNLEANTKVETIDNVEVPIYRGSIVKLWNELNISNTYYSRVMRNLEELGCINILQRGAANMGSVVAVLHPPDPGKIFLLKPLTPPRADATMVAELENVKRNIGGVNIQEALREVDKRVTELEREVRQIAEKS